MTESRPRVENKSLWIKPLKRHTHWPSLSVLRGLYWYQLIDSLLPIGFDLAEFFLTHYSSWRSFLIYSYLLVCSACLLLLNSFVSLLLVLTPSCNVSWICEGSSSWEKLVTKEVDLFCHAMHAICFLLFWSGYCRKLQHLVTLPWVRSCR